MMAVEFDDHDLSVLRPLRSLSTLCVRMWELLSCPLIKNFAESHSSSYSKLETL